MTEEPAVTLSNDNNELSGEVALVTGASAGLGWRFSQVLADAGAHVVAVSRREERLQELAKQIRDAGGQCTPIAADMTDATALMDLVSRARDLCGTTTILVNNAGIPDAQLATRMPIDLIDRVLSTNVRAPFILSTQVAGHLIKERKPGRIVNMSSIVAYNYSGNGAALYSVTKAAISRMTEALAVEWARFNINVNAIAPGYFHSEMTDGMLGRVGDFSQKLPRKRIAEPPQLDSTLLYLCSPKSECVTGTIIKVDDGQEAR